MKEHIHDLIEGTGNTKQNLLIEFLNGQIPLGIALHKFNLKVGAIIMLPRNFNEVHSMEQGNLLVKERKSNLIIAEALTDLASNEFVFISRIELAPTDIDLPFTIRRR